MMLEATRRRDFGCFLPFDWVKMVVTFKLEHKYTINDAVKGF